MSNNKLSGAEKREIVTKAVLKAIEPYLAGAKGNGFKMERESVWQLYVSYTGYMGGMRKPVICVTNDKLSYRTGPKQWENEVFQLDTTEDAADAEEFIVKSIHEIMDKALKEADEMYM